MMSFQNRLPLILASTSPQRFELFSQLNFPFETAAPAFEEISDPNLSPAEEALHFARQKALSVAERFPNSLIIGCDTLVSFQNQKLGKPEDSVAALKMLLQLRGASHEVISSLAVWNAASRRFYESTVVVPVRMKNFSETEARDYVATGEPIGKAGACCLQGLGATLIESVEGEESAVVGLPLRELKEILAGLGWG